MTKLLCGLLLTVTVVGCGSSSSDSKNTDNTVKVTNTTEETSDITDTQICNDTTKQLNLAGTFEKVSQVQSNGMKLITRIRLEENGDGNGTLVLEISCSLNNVGASDVGKIPYKRTGNSIETLQEIELSAESGTVGNTTCSIKGTYPKATFTMTPKNSCLIINSPGAEDTFVPTLKQI